MTIAVRVSVWILGVLVVVSAAVAVLALTQKQTLQEQNQSLHNQIASDESQLADLTTKAKRLEDDAVQLNSKISQAQAKISQTQQEKDQLQSTYDDLKRKSDALQAQLDQADSDRDDWKSRVETISRERDQANSARDDLKKRVETVSRERDGLVEKLKHPPVKIVYKDRIVKVTAPAPTPESLSALSSQADQYWASVLKQKAALQVEIQKEKTELDQAALQVVDLKKQNSDLDLQLKQIRNEKDEIIRKIKYGQDLADNLSIDLARSRNDQQAVNDRADKLKEENLGLLSQIRGLNSTKLGLEKTVARLTDEKDAMQKKLIETGSIIQSRIDDIWKIKEGLDKKLSENTPPPSSGSGSMELPPIIVNASNNQQQARPPVNNPTLAASMIKKEGSVISINMANNFVIVDLGQENSSVNVGTALKVYRNSQEIATLEVIQVRRDICAGDIKNKSSELKVGDIVKF